MSWFDKMPKIPKIEEFTSKAKEWMGSDEKSENKQDQDNTDLGQLTQMLNDPKKGPMFEEQFGMDISGAKEKDGVVTPDETVPIVAEFSQKLVKGGYLKDVAASEKKENETTLKEELGDDVDSYNQLSPDQKDALLIFISTPEAQRQEAIQKAVQDGGFSYVPTDSADKNSNYVLVDDTTGNVIELNPTNMTKTHAYTEVPEVPPFINSENDLG